MNTKQAQLGDIVRTNEGVAQLLDITVGNLYYVGKTEETFVQVIDDVGDYRDLSTSAYEVVGKLQDMVMPPAPPVKELRDIHAQSVQVGDYVAYNYAIGVLKVFEIVTINGDVADGRCVIMDSIYPNLGVFNERAIKLKDYVK